MLSLESLRHLFSLQSAAWTSTAILFLLAVRMWNGAPAMFAQWIAYRQAKAAERSGDWSRLRAEITRLDERCDHLQKEVDECREREAEWMHRAIAAEAFQLGEGEALQKAQRIVSADREEVARKREHGDGDA